MTAADDVQPATSLRFRLLAAAAIVLAAFVALTGLGLDRAFRDAARAAQQDRMQGLVYGLLGAAEPRENGLTITKNDLPEPALARPESGLAAFIAGDDGRVIWTSDSWIGRPPELPTPGTGKWRFEQGPAGNHFLLAFGVRWLDDGDNGTDYTVAVVEDTSAYAEQQAAFRQTLGFWLIAASLALLVVQLGVLWWGTTPIRRLADDIRTIETGERDELTGTYPRELQPVTQALNAMIRAERTRLERQRAALADLAHSLKTPLAVLRGIAESPPADWPNGVSEQVATMHAIVNRQLTRAATAGRRTLTRPISLAPMTRRIADAMRKVHADREPAIDVRIPDTLQARIDEGDYYELLGNLVDNALKHGGRQVRIDAHSEGDALHLAVTDDGPGLSGDPGCLVERGARADNRMPGQGIGLAVCRDIVLSLDGDLELDTGGDLGGARIRIRLPGVAGASNRGR